MSPGSTDVHLLLWVRYGTEPKMMWIFKLGLRFLVQIVAHMYAVVNSLSDQQGHAVS